MSAVLEHVVGVTLLAVSAVVAAPLIVAWAAWVITGAKK